MSASRIKILCILIAFCSFIFGCKRNVDQKTDSKKEKAIHGLDKNDSTLYSVQDAMKSIHFPDVVARNFRSWKIMTRGWSTSGTLALLGMLIGKMLIPIAIGTPFFSLSHALIAIILNQSLTL